MNLEFYQNFNRTIVEFADTTDLDMTQGLVIGPIRPQVVPKLVQVVQRKRQGTRAY
ncbi:MAG TPA: hypothetical protein VJ184_12165 [Chryseolinea sp.]|nr:hypothetical protein [Chryseolinea sp.]